MRAAVALWLTLTCFCAAGCGGHGNRFKDFDRVRGRVFLAEDLDEDVERARVQLLTSTGFQSEQLTDGDGRFDFRNVPRSDIRLTVTAEDPSLAPVTVEMPLFVQLYFAIPVPSFSMGPEPVITSLQVVPEQTTVEEGKGRRFRVVAVPPTDHPPIWVVEGGIGRVNAKGEFAATSVGRGFVTAILGGLRASAKVRVKEKEQEQQNSGITVTFETATSNDQL